ncbi:DUF2927 domain-containing protein [Phaeobacter italicus]|uniref:DUF2927 domain-containing protein n=1 Tax=Phaeobacter italicus TaxID=481446 RepID=UPI001ADA3AEA|nr:DUF2927 domain-containing protein [Phaeobacter italicus]MBO9443015.1 DUF2927 domain-containing protein [Phaeobacter italicus]
MPATCTTPAPRHALHRRLAALALCCAMAVAGCAPQGGTPPDRARRDLAPLAPAKSFARAHPVAPARANADIARDFLDLHFRLESGTELAVFSRFEGPITLRVTGRPSAGLMRDLEALIARLRREAGLRISLTTAEDANITIEAVSRKAIRQASPRAACFVVPNVTSLKEFRRNKRRPATNWANLRQRTRLAIFVPNDVSAQETRDCLHEEIAQAIGPLNDLYRLSDSVFNDDNVHTVLTGFDMLILRATYAPELRTGMRRAEVAARLPAILARMNPAGHNRAARPLPATPRSWIRATEGALSPGVSREARLAAAHRGAAIARDLGWQDHRRAFNHYILGRILQREDPVLAQRHFETALSYLQGSHDSPILRARIATRMAAFDITRGAGRQALARIMPSLPVAARSENAVLLSTLMLLQAEALDLEGQTDAARAVRLDSEGWARYGFGSDWAVRGAMREIAALAPPR